MSAEVVLAVLVILLGGPMTILAHRNLRAFRTMKEDDSLRAWRARDRRRQRAIKRKLSRGQAVEDRQEAILALEVVEPTERVVRLMRPLQWISTTIALAFLVFGIVDAEWRFLAWVGGAMLALEALVTPLTWFQRRRFRHAAHATRQRMG